MSAPATKDASESDAAKNSIAAQLKAEEDAAREERRKAREARRQMRRAARDKMRADLRRKIGLKDEESDPAKLVMQNRRCVWRDESGLGNRLQDIFERQYEEEARATAMGKAVSVVKRRSFIPVSKLGGLIGYWLNLFYQQTRSFQKAVAAKKMGNSSGNGLNLATRGDILGIAAPILPDIVVRDRMKASKGNEQSLESYLEILVRSVTHFRHSPRVYLFGLVCGLFPDQGWGFAPNAGLVLAAALKQVSRDAASFDVSQLAKGGSCWISGDVADGVIRNLFNGEPNWSLEHWKESCQRYKVAPMWNDPSDRRELNQQVATTTSLVGEIEPKDRRSLPSEVKNSGFNTRIADLDKFLVVILSSWLELRRQTIEALEDVEQRRMAKERMHLEAKRDALRRAQERPFEKYEIRYLKLGVRRHGVGEWQNILNDTRLVFVYRTPQRLEHEWQVISERRHRREQRRWDWRRWPWNPEWEWGALKVKAADKSSQDSGRDAYREDWDVWDDMDITDDEDNEELIQSSEDDTATDSDLDVSDVENEIENNHGAGSGGALLGLISSSVAGTVSSSPSTPPGDSLQAGGARIEPHLERDTFQTASAPVLVGTNNGTAEAANVVVDHSASHHTSDTFRHKDYGLSPNQKRHVRSQPVLPELPSSVSNKRVMRRSSTELQLGHYNFGDHSAEALSQRLGVNGRAVDTVDRSLLPLEEDMQQMQAKAYPGLSAIDTMVLRDCGLTGSGFKALCRNIKGNNYITSLDLRRNKLGEVGIKALSRVLADSACALKVLDLDSTGLRDRDFVMLAQAVEQRMTRYKEGKRQPPSSQEGAGDDENKLKYGKKKKTEVQVVEEFPCALEEVHFGHNDISDGSCESLGVLLDNLPKLKHLDLSWNRLKAMSAVALAERMGVHAGTCKLEVLNLQFNSIGNSGAACLMDLVSGIEPFPKAPKLKVLDMSFNGIYVGGVMDQVMNVVSKSPHLSSLQLNGNEVQKEEVDQIRRALSESSYSPSTQELLIGLAGSAVADPLAAILE